jgi:hypothetical protein
MGKTALIIGATGLVGGACLARLLKEDSFERVVAITRTPLAVKHDKLFNAVVDFNHPASFLEYCVGDVLFSAMGTTIGKAGSKEAFFKVDYTYPYEVAKAAKAKWCCHTRAGFFFRCRCRFRNLLQSGERKARTRHCFIRLYNEYYSSALYTFGGTERIEANGAFRTRICSKMQFFVCWTPCPI